MSWIRGRCKGQDVWVEVVAGGAPKVDGGRVAVRYSDRAGARLYRAGVANVEVMPGEIVELPEGVSADAGPAAKTPRGSGFGSANSRTAGQAAAAQVAAAALVAGFDPEAAICFTDGACIGNPGPAGSGAVVRLPDGRHIEAHLALGKGTNNTGELSAIRLAIDLLDRAGFPEDGQVEILTDSSYCRGVLAQGWKAKANQELIADVKAALRRRRARLHWIAGHVGVPENERADALANLGAEESRRA